MLTLENVEVTYQGVVRVLRGVSLEVPDGQIVAVLGSNGAGKSTTLKSISGLLKQEDGAVTEGLIRLDGRNIQNQPPDFIGALGVVHVVEGRRVFPHLTVLENMMAGGHRQSSAEMKRDLDRVFTYFPVLKDLKGRIAGYCSGGEQQMAVIARALMTRPSLILLDEPSLGLSPMTVEVIFGVLQRISTEEKTSILLVEQNVPAALQIARHGYVMELGRIVLDGPSEKLAGNEDIREFYLGFSNVGVKKSYRDVKHYRRRKRWLSS